MATRNHTDADFNSKSREVQCKLAVYFDSTPVEFTSYGANKCIMQLDITEEAYAEGTDVLGDVSANYIDIKLYNSNGMFSPTNPNGPYVGKIKLNVKIIPYLRLVNSVDTLNWVQLGVFYVSDWNAAITASTASIYATDIMQEVITCDSTEIHIRTEHTFKTFLDYYFDALGYYASVDSSLTTSIPYAYADAKVKSTINKLISAAKALCFSSRTGTVTVRAINNGAALRATLTDSDQIVSIASKQSLLKTYDGVDLTYKLPQLTAGQEVLSMSGVGIEAGVSTLTDLAFDAGPVYAIESLQIKSVESDVTLNSFAYTPWLLTITTNNTDTVDSLVDISVQGTTLELTDAVLSDKAYSMLTYSNPYLQSKATAESYKLFLEAFVDTVLPTLTLQIRGNLLLTIGDKITISSVKYGVTYTGIIIRAKHTYVGYLSSTITLLNSSIVEAA